MEAVTPGGRGLEPFLDTKSPFGLATEVSSPMRKHLWFDRERGVSQTEIPQVGSSFWGGPWQFAEE